MAEILTANCYMLEEFGLNNYRAKIEKILNLFESLVKVLREKKKNIRNF